ncbi:radical SAM protein [bacterium]|nr:radical SAM protein [bacterium]
MSNGFSPKVKDILKKASDMQGIDKAEAVSLLRLDLHGAETYAVMGLASEISRSAFRGKGERHLNVGLNAASCSLNCRFCSLARDMGNFSESVEFSEEQMLGWARAAEREGADALYLMTTADFSFERLLEVGRVLGKETAVPVVANTGDLDHRQGEALLEAGFVGAYHAIRLREGVDTPISPERRLGTIRMFSEVGLLWMNCVEPVGPEHGPEEIADLMVLAREYGATYSGVMRRVNFPGSPLAAQGVISELELARMVAVSRLVMGNVAKAHCTHEPNMLSLAAGANLLFPEAGSSPRDVELDTGEGRGRSPRDCGGMLREAEWDPDLAFSCVGSRSRGPRAADPA